MTERTTRADRLARPTTRDAVRAASATSRSAASTSAATSAPETATCKRSTHAATSSSPRAPPGSRLRSTACTRASTTTTGCGNRPNSPARSASSASPRSTPGSCRPFTTCSPPHPRSWRGPRACWPRFAPRAARLSSSPTASSSTSRSPTAPSACWSSPSSSRSPRAPPTREPATFVPWWAHPGPRRVSRTHVAVQLSAPGGRTLSMRHAGRT